VRHVGHVRMRRDDDRRAMGLVLARRHVLGLQRELRLLLVGIVPLRHVLLLLLLLVGRRVRRYIVLGVVVLRVGVVDGRVCLRREVVVLGLALPPSLVDCPREHVGTGHHCRLLSTMPSQSALVRDRATNV
jgi:hypothetical protein